MKSASTWRKRFQAGHGCFNAYLKCFKKRDDESCRYCSSPVDDAEHTLFVCAKWGAARETVGRAVGVEFTPATLVPVMLQSRVTCAPGCRAGVERNLYAACVV